jgi:hypothetical protein
MYPPPRPGRSCAADREGSSHRLSVAWRPPTTPAEFELIERVWRPLRDLGWIEGQNLIVERRYAGNRTELLRPLVEELIRFKVEIIVTNGTTATLAAKNATTTIPIVIFPAGDPMAAGFAASLAACR